MIYHNNSQLQSWLKETDRRRSAPFFEFDDEEFARAVTEIESRHHTMEPAQVKLRAAYHLLTNRPDFSPGIAIPSGKNRSVFIPWKRVFSILKIAWAILLLIGIWVLVAKSEPPHNVLSTEQVLSSAIRRGVWASPPTGGIVIQLQNQGTALATRGGGLVVFNCTTNLSCSFSGSTFAIATGGGVASGGPYTSNGILFGNGTSTIQATAAGGAGTLCLIETAGGTPTFGSCAGSAGTVWSSLSNPTANLSLLHGAFTSTFTWGAATGAGVNLFTLTDTLNNTGTGILGRFTLASGSAALPFQADANGIGWRVNNAGNLFPVSTATMAIPGTTRGVVVSEGASAAIATTGTGTAGQLLTSNGAGADPTFQDPTISYNAPAESTVAWTSATALNTALAVNLITGTSGLSSVVVTLNQGSTITAGAVNFEVSDTTAFTNAYNASCWQATTGNVISSYTLVASTNQAFVCNVVSYAAFRVRLNPAITGTGTVNVGEQPSAGPTQPNAVALQGAAATLAGAWPAKVTDGTNGPAAVKPASTAVAAADPSFAVGLSPNSPLPTGSNTIGAISNTGFNVTGSLPTGSNTIGKVDVLGNAGAVLDAAGQNAAAPANWVATGCVFFTAPTTLTTANGTYLNCDSASNLLTRMNSWLGSTAPTVGQKTSANSIPVVPASDFVDTATGNKSDNGAAAAANRVNVIPGIYRSDYGGGTAGTAGNDAVPDVGKDHLLHVATMPMLSPTSRYSASTTTTAAASPTDLAGLPGNASNTVVVTKVLMGCTQTTAGILTMNLLKRTTADTAGTSSSTAIHKQDSTGAAAVSVPLTYTANPTLGTQEATTANVDTWQGGAMATGTATPNDIYIGNFERNPIVLRGTAEVLYINFGGTAHSGLSCSTTFFWMEVTTISP